MGKIHNALQKVEPDYQKSLTLNRTPTHDIGKALVNRPQELSDKQFEKYHEVKIKMITRSPQSSIKTILITGTADGDGSTTTAVNFAQTLAQDQQSKVLLIDTNFRSPSFHEIFNMDYNQVLSMILSNQEAPSSIFNKVRNNLYILASDKNQSSPLSLFDSPMFDVFMKAARDAFSYVILDGPPVNNYADPLIIGSKVDGVILVINSGKTRRQVAMNAKKELIDSGANVLGVILNRRKYYVPQWLYDKL